MKILLVDDDVFLRDMYATKFTELGHEVKAAENGERALELIGSEHFDIALIDMIMPGMTGLELLKRIRDQISSPPQCVVLSNQGGKDDIEEAEKAGAKGYIIKAELIPSEVVAEVVKLFERNGARK